MFSRKHWHCWTAVRIRFGSRLSQKVSLSYATAISPAPSNTRFWAKTASGQLLWPPLAIHPRWWSSILGNMSCQSWVDCTLATRTYHWFCWPQVVGAKNGLKEGLCRIPNFKGGRFLVTVLCKINLFACLCIIVLRVVVAFIILCILRMFVGGLSPALTMSPGPEGINSSPFWSASATPPESQVQRWNPKSDVTTSVPSGPEDTSIVLQRIALLCLAMSQIKS